MGTFDPIRHLRETTEGAYQMLLKDLRAIPEEKAGQAWGGCSRAPLRFVAECAMLNGVLAAYIETGVFRRPSREEALAQQESFPSIEPLAAFLQQQTELLLKAIDGVDPDTLWEEGNEPFGRPMSRFQAIGLAATHMNYHDGQLNYVQAMLGDPAIHW